MRKKAIESYLDIDKYIADRTQTSKLARPSCIAWAFQRAETRACRLFESFSIADGSIEESHNRAGSVQRLLELGKRFEHVSDRKIDLMSEAGQENDVRPQLAKLAASLRVRSRRVGDDRFHLFAEHRLTQ